MQIKEKNTMIQDIFPMHLSNEYHKKVPQADSFLMILKITVFWQKDGQVMLSDL